MNRGSVQVSGMKKAGSGGMPTISSSSAVAAGNASSPSKAVGSVRKATNSASANYVKPNLSGIPRRNTYNYAEGKGPPATIDAPTRYSTIRSLSGKMPRFRRLVCWEVWLLALFSGVARLGRTGHVEAACFFVVTSSN